MTQPRGRALLLSLLKLSRFEPHPGVSVTLWVMLVALLAEEKVNGRPHLSASCLLERRKEFHRNLVNIVKQHHKVRTLPQHPFGVWGGSGHWRSRWMEWAGSRRMDMGGSCGVLLAGRCWVGGWWLESSSCLHISSCFQTTLGA